jgi:thiol-disulfide isomerase/thioredoxin
LISAAAAAQALTSIDGASVDLSNQKGKVVVLAVGASWLPLSAKQTDYANALAKKYAGKSVAFYFVATDSTNPKSKNFATADDIRKFAATNKLSMTVLLDPEGAVTRHKYDIDQFPSFVIIDKTGMQSGESIGGVDSTGKYDLTGPLSKAIDKLL